MQQLWYFTLLACFSFVNICEAKKQKAPTVPYVVSQLFRDQSKQPIIFYFKPHLDPKLLLLRDVDELNLRNLEIDDNNEDLDISSLRTSQNDERAYILYHLLRSTLEDDDVNPSAVESLQYTKGLLRQALIGRCRKLNSCYKKCPTIKFTCKIKCKQIFDDLDACEEPKEINCQNSKCGKTMPPKWLL